MSQPQLQVRDCASPSCVSGVGHLGGEVRSQSPSPCVSARPLCWAGAVGRPTSAKGASRTSETYLTSKSTAFPGKFLKNEESSHCWKQCFHLGKTQYRINKVSSSSAYLILILISLWVLGLWRPEEGLVLWTPLPSSFTKLNLLLHSVVMSFGFTFMERQNRVSGRHRETTWFGHDSASARPDLRLVREGKTANFSRNILLQFFFVPLFPCWGKPPILVSSPKLTWFWSNCSWLGFDRTVKCKS